MSPMRSLFDGLEDESDMADDTATPSEEANSPTPEQQTPPKKKAAKKSPAYSTAPKKTSSKKAVAVPIKEAGTKTAKRTRTVRPYPSVAFKEATQIGDAIFKFASGEKVRRLTLLEKMDRSPNSGATKMLITNSGKYGITTGSYSAQFLELTKPGKVACDPNSDAGSRVEAQFKLAISDIPPFKLLYDSYVSKKIPAHEVMKDVLADAGVDVENPTECIDLFIVNTQFLGLLRPIAGAETLIPIEQKLEELGKEPTHKEQPADEGEVAPNAAKRTGGSKWETTCFYITPIGEEGSDARKHSDLFLSALVEPALEDLKLKVIRSDQIADPGMITSNILEHIKKCKLVIADLSLLNPNVFYEVALRHSLKLPIVQIIQKADKLPFDVNQVNSLIIDNTDIYTFTPKLDTYRSQITTLSRRAIEDPEHVGNPITIFFPDFWK